MAGETHTFSLKYFYYGLLVQDGKPVGNQPGVIASTPGLTEGIVQECLRMAPLPPPSLQERTPEMPGALGLFRAGTTSFILAKAQFNDANLPQIMYALLPVDTLRLMGGNPVALSTFAKRSMPAFATPSADLAPLVISDVGPPTDDELSEALYSLILECRDSFDTIEHILAGLVQGQPVVIVNSPANIDRRLTFLQGLLALIPQPARVSLSYATHYNPELVNPAQIKFTSSRVIPENHLVYDWGTGELLTEPKADPYSHYMVSQLRLDPALAIEQTGQLGRAMVWRASQEGTLSTALAWVSRRAAVDQAVRENQPADSETVAAILREDPTLPDDARQMYARHVLAFALALNDYRAADVIPIAAAQYPVVADAVRDQFQAALNKGQAYLVFQMIEHWMLNVKPASPFQWQSLLHTAARQRFIDQVASGNSAQAIHILNEIRAANPDLHLQDSLGHLLEAALPYTVSDPALSRTLFLTAVEHLSAGQFQRLASNDQFVLQLAPEVRRAIHHLQHSEIPAPPHVLSLAANTFEPSLRSLVFARLIEWASFHRRVDLIDSSALSALLVLVETPYNAQFTTLVHQVTHDLSESAALVQKLDTVGQRILIQLLMRTGQVARAVGLLEYCQDSLYGLERSSEFAQLAAEVFRALTLPTPEITAILESLDGSKIRPDARVRVYLSVLETGQWDASHEYSARRLTGALFTDCQLIRHIGLTNALRLLDFYYRQRNPLDALRVAAAMTDFLADKPQESADLIARMWPLMSWNAETTEAATELLRRHLRRVPVEIAPRLIDHFAKTIDPKIGPTLRATTVMRLILGGMSIEDWAEGIRITAQMLIDIAAVYHSQKELPPNHRLRRDLDTMTGSLTDEERAVVAQNMANITRLIYDLGRTRTNRRSRPPVEEQLVSGQASPHNGVDLLRLIGGHFADHHLLPLDLGREAMMHIFGNRSASMFLQETTTISTVLNGLYAGFSTQDRNDPPLPPDALTGELDSLWNTLSLYNQRRLQKQIAKDCQHLAEVISVMADRGDEKLFSHKGLGQQLETGQRQPRTSLEALRWITGYFERKHEPG